MSKHDGFACSLVHGGVHRMAVATGFVLYSLQKFRHHWAQASLGAHGCFACNAFIHIIGTMVCSCFRKACSCPVFCILHMRVGGCATSWLVLSCGSPLRNLLHMCVCMCGFLPHPLSFNHLMWLSISVIIGSCHVAWCQLACCGKLPLLETTVPLLLHAFVIRLGW
jgi:hypothetical protein